MSTLDIVHQKIAQHVFNEFAELESDALVRYEIRFNYVSLWGYKQGTRFFLTFSVTHNSVSFWDSFKKEGGEITTIDPADKEEWENFDNRVNNMIADFLSNF